MRGIILAGGEGTRLRPLTYITNKHLLPVYNKPMILYPLETLKGFGCTNILVVSGGNHIGAFAEFLGDGTDFGVNITYRVQKKAGGIAQALGLAKDFSNGEPVLVILGDNVFGKLDVTLDETKANIFLKEVDNPNRFGVAQFGSDGKLINIVEKPQIAPSKYAVTGLYYYPNEVFDVIKTLKPSARGELEVTDINNYFVDRGCAHHTLDTFWSDAGTFESLSSSAEWAKYQS